MSRGGGGLGKGMEIRGWVAFSPPPLVLLTGWRDTLDLAEDAKCKALLEEAMNKVDCGRGSPTPPATLMVPSPLAPDLIATGLGRVPTSCRAEKRRE